MQVLHNINKNIVDQMAIEAIFCWLFSFQWQWFGNFIYKLFGNATSVQAFLSDKEIYKEPFRVNCGQALIS